MTKLVTMNRPREMSATLQANNPAADVIALARSVGLSGVRPLESGTYLPPPAAGNPAADIIALARSVGIEGVRRSEDAATMPPTVSNDAITDSVALARSVGMAGVSKAGKGVDPTQVARAAGLDGFGGAHTQSPTLSPVAASPAAAARLTHQSYAVLEVEPGGEAALAQLESTMGTAFAADRNGQPYWFGATSADGGTSRAFTFMGSQLTTFADLLGEIGSSSLRLSVQPIELNRYELTGPGASAVGAGRGAPQLPLSLPKAVRTALGR